MTTLYIILLFITIYNIACIFFVSSIFKKINTIDKMFVSPKTLLKVISIIVYVVICGVVIPSIILQDNTLSRFDNYVAKNKDEKAYLKTILRQENKAFDPNREYQEFNHLPIKITKYNFGDGVCDNKVSYKLFTLGLGVFFLPVSIGFVECGAESRL